MLSLDKIFTTERLNEALAFLSTKRDSCGSDGLFLSSLESYWLINGKRIMASIYAGTFQPGMVRLTEIVSKKGSRRTIAAFNSVDRLLLRCIAQALQDEFDEKLSPFCFAYRPNLGLTKAVDQAADNM